MTYQKFLEMVVLNVAGVDTEDTMVVLNINGVYYGLEDQMTWESSIDEIWGDTLVIHGIPTE